MQNGLCIYQFFVVMIVAFRQIAKSFRGNLSRDARDGSYVLARMRSLDEHELRTSASFETVSISVVYLSIIAITVKLTKIFYQTFTTTKNLQGYRFLHKIYFESSVHYSKQSNWINVYLIGSHDYFLHAKRQEVRLLLVEFNKVALSTQCAVFWIM